MPTKTTQKQQPPTLNTPSLKLCFCPAAVSKAFSCLSNADNRAAYDRYGDQEGAAGFPRQRRAGPTAQGFGGDGFDAEEIFNMFFGNGFGARRASDHLGSLLWTIASDASAPCARHACNPISDSEHAKHSVRPVCYTQKWQLSFVLNPEPYIKPKCQLYSTCVCTYIYCTDILIYIVYICCRPGAGANVFRHNFGGPPRQPQQGGQQQGGNPMHGLLHLIPVVILLLFTFLSSPSEPVSPVGCLCHVYATCVQCAAFCCQSCVGNQLFA